MLAAAFLAEGYFGLFSVLALFMSIGLSAWAAPVRASDESTAEQIYLILAQFDSLKQDGGSDAWLYAVTDLDHNGRPLGLLTVFVLAAVLNHPGLSRDFSDNLRDGSGGQN